MKHLNGKHLTHILASIRLEKLKLSLIEFFKNYIFVPKQSALNAELYSWIVQIDFHKFKNN